MRSLSLMALVLASAIAAPAQAVDIDDAHAVALAMPRELTVATCMSPADRDAVLKPVNAFYGFWENGSAALLADAVSAHFLDHTLPPGRPQGPTGPAIASRGFLAAVPDLQMTVTQRLVVGDRVVSHLRFAGHFTSTFQGVQGKGQAVDFIATDILRVQDGRITDNWHLEDNLSFLMQIGMVGTR